MPEKKAFFSPFTMTKNPFWVSRNHFQWEKRPKIFTNAYGQAGGVTPHSVRLTENRTFFFDDFPYPGVPKKGRHLGKIPQSLQRKVLYKKSPPLNKFWGVISVCMLSAISEMSNSGYFQILFHKRSNKQVANTAQMRSEVKTARRLFANTRK